MNNLNDTIRVSKNKPPSVFWKDKWRNRKINEENIENNLVFSINPEKAFAIKSNPRSVFFFFFRNLPYKNKIRLFPISVKLWFRLLYKILTKQTVYLNNFARKSGFRLQFLRQSASWTHHCWRGLMTFPITFFSQWEKKSNKISTVYLQKKIST